MSKKTIETGKQYTRGSFVPDSYDEEKNTVEVTWSVGAKGKRGCYNPFLEELSMKKDHVRMDRLNNGAPVLNSHFAYDLRDNMGVVQKAWIKSKVGGAILRLSSREENQGYNKDIRDGVIRNISVGYKVHEYTDVSKKDDAIPTYRATDWEPLEISFVNIGFDDSAQTRSKEDSNSERFQTLIIESKENAMSKEEIKREIEKNNTPVVKSTVEEKVQPVDNGEEATRTVETEKVETPLEAPKTVEVKVERTTEEIQKDEMERGISIRSAVSTVGLDEKVADELIKSGVSVDVARKTVIDRKAELDKAAVTNSNVVEVTEVDQRKLRIESAANAILHKQSDGKVELKDSAREYRGMNLIRMAEHVLTSQGEKVLGMTPNDIAERALHHSSDFVEILANVANKSLRDAYGEAPQTFAPFTRNVEVADFKQISRTQLGDAPSLEKVNESGEYKSGTISDAAEKYKIDTFGKIVGITRQTLINDDLDAFTRLPEMFGRSARDLESNLIYNEIIANPNMADGNALFSAAHGNLAAGGDIGAIGIATVAAAREAMRLQLGLDGAKLNLRPELLVVPVALETAGEQFLGPIIPNVNASVNPFTGKLQLIPEARLDADSAIKWYVFALKSQIDMFEMARLSGQNGPTLSSKAGFETDGVKFKVSYDIGVKAIDWRGMYLNPGA